MSWKKRLLAVLDVVLRVPPLFIMDAILNNTTITNSSDVYNTTPFMFIRFQDLLWCLVLLIGFMVALVIFLLSTPQLLETYVWLVSLGIILTSIWWNNNLISFYNQQNENFFKGFIDSSTKFNISDNVSYLLEAVVIQLSLAFTFTTVHYSSRVPKILSYASFLYPVIGIHLPFSKSFYQYLPILAAALPLFQVIFAFCYHLKEFVKSANWAVLLSRNFIKHYGLQLFLEREWTRLHVPNVLRVFWITRFAEHAVFMIFENLSDRYMYNLYFSLNLDKISYMFQSLLIRGSETIISIMGMTSIVSKVTWYIGYIVQLFLSCEDDEDKSIGAVSAILFFILALQTGLTGLEPEKRLVRLFRNMCLLLTAVLHFIHNTVNTQLMSLSASNNTSLKKHSRALVVCCFLMFFPCYFVHYLWHQHTLSTWLLAVTAFSIEVVIKTIISLLVYALFLIDACQETFWENLDDYIYYIRATGNTIAFMFGIFLFCNGGFILIFESGGSIRAFMMGVHAYFNIWLQAKEGWKVFIQRRTAVKKINLLPEAKPEQLSNFYDVCAICYQELTSARITQCNHYFHSVCLRKWLYIQDKCPLCHQIMYKINETNDVNQTNNSEIELQMNNAWHIHEHHN